MIKCVLVLSLILGPIRYTVEDRILNGNYAAVGEYPSMISVQIHYRIHVCGGTILNSKHILTAAHCVFAIKGKYNSTIQYGAIDRQSKGNRITVIRGIVHEKYLLKNWNVAEHDVGILILQEKIPFSELAHPVNLPQQDEHTESSTAVAVGWGKDEYNTMTVLLKHINVRIYSDEECANIYPNDYVKTINICAFSDEFGTGVCNGDSGGPLIVNGKQVGIASWVAYEGCATQGTADVFTKVSTYVDWIHQILEGNNIGKNIKVA